MAKRYDVNRSFAGWPAYWRRLRLRLNGLYDSMMEGPRGIGFVDAAGSLMGHRALGLAVRHPPLCDLPLSAPNRRGFAFGAHRH
jgi:hypothetical protein